MHKVLLWAAGATLLLGASLLTYAGTRSDWREATAEVLSVQLGCTLTSTTGFRNRSTRVVVACNQVDQFRADNPGKSWTLSRYYKGRVRITGEGPMTVVQMGLNGYFGTAPQVGDQVRVLRNPARPEEVSNTNWQWHVGIPGYLLLGLAGLFAALAFAWF